MTVEGVKNPVTQAVRNSVHILIVVRLEVILDIDDMHYIRESAETHMSRVRDAK